MEKMVSRKVLFHCSMLATICLVLAACPLPLQTGALPLVVAGETVTLEWDPPPYGVPGTDGALSYQVYYRPHASPTWTLLLATPPGARPTITLERSRIGTGSFDFAVKAVNGIGESSALHQSEDADAYPPGGWYVIWN
jgi:hypothetical protein